MTLRHRDVSCFGLALIWASGKESLSIGRSRRGRATPASAGHTTKQLTEQMACHPASRHQLDHFAHGTEA